MFLQSEGVSMRFFFNDREWRLGAAALILGLCGGLPAHAQAELLEPDAAFRVQVLQKDKNTLVAQFDIAKDYYLYKQRMRFALKDSPGMALQSIRYPTGTMKQDAIFGRTEVFKNRIEIELSLERVGANKVAVVVDYQGCEEKRGVCYAPMQKTFTLALR
ncbi:cytochrome C biogenesis protein [Herbaspirillum sp. HC18]|nr:cytochrome C biogenesis protein [Herbaspirillum sp. HC18]